MKIWQRLDEFHCESGQLRNPSDWDFLLFCSYQTTLAQALLFLTRH